MLVDMRIFICIHSAMPTSHRYPIHASCERWDEGVSVSMRFLACCAGIGVGEPGRSA
jgi:hypothetical protein